MRKFLKIIFYPIKEVFIIVAKAIIFWPTSKLGLLLRRKYYSKYLKSVGKSPIIYSGVRFEHPHLIAIGNSCIFGRNVQVNAGNSKGIFIGNNVSIADGSYLRAGNHAFSNPNIPIQQQGHTYMIVCHNDVEFSIVVEDDVWIGARAIILSGAKIGHGTIISAGAVVSSEIPPYSIVVGNPGRVIRNRLKLNKL